MTPVSNPGWYQTPVGSGIVTNCSYFLNYKAAEGMYFHTQDILGQKDFPTHTTNSPIHPILSQENQTQSNTCCCCRGVYFYI